MERPIAVLIGFAYQDLNGTLIDLHRAYTWCRSFDCKIKVITDLLNPSNKKVYEELEGKNVVSNKKEFIRALDSKLNSNQIIIYYTGHGLESGIELPDRSILSFDDFRDLILKNVPGEAEIFWIMDCCNPNGLSLPYQLKNNQFVLHNTEAYYGLHRILLITSASAHEKSVATQKGGSVFTRYLFDLLSNMTITDFDPQKPLPLIHNRNLQRLIGNLSSAIRTVHSGFNQTVCIYSSYIQDPVLWMWIGTSKPYLIKGDYDAIIITRINKLILTDQTTNN